MSLTIQFTSKVDHVSINFIENQINNKNNNLFGFEAWRKELWGNEIMKDLKCNFIYSLKSNDLFVFDNDISLLQKECKTVIENIEIISKKTNIETEAILFRINNLKEYIRVCIQEINLIGLNIS